MTDQTARTRGPSFRAADRADHCIRFAVLTAEDTAAALIDRAIELRARSGEARSPAALRS